MNLRASELLPLAEWLDDRLRGAVVQGVRAPAADTAVLSLRRPGLTVHLLVAARPGGCRFHTVPKPPPNPERPFALQGLLRKELGGRLQSLSMPGGDRLLRLDFGDRVLLTVLYDRAADVLLLDRGGVVLGSVRGSHARGAIWTPPASPAPRLETDRFEGLDGALRDQAIHAAFDGAEEERERASLRRRLRARREALARRADKQEAEADRADEAEDLQRRGELLRGVYARLGRGMTTVEVPDFYEGGTRHIELDPALDAAQNLDRLFNRARKARRAGDEAGRRLLETLDELETLDDALRSLDDDPEPDLEALAGLLPTRRRRQRRRDEPRLPYRTYRTPSGVEIRVGRGARDNDDLTFRHSKGNDVWLHVRGRPGAHVVIRAPGPQPSPELLVLAAQVALHHSGIKPGAREEVAWTRVKHVRKPKGLPPGKVMPGGVKVLYVEADPEVLRTVCKE